ncbi:hypothetical protein B0H17DRAFT_1132378 [Mycena rosella]|uniref:Uncharacterized protein n=1 Tax=Mycena rosella TaxID=1033263 RepID=A0AAD7DKR4_MYCRO|nr:hypothetical protein B0H17DRAFT_1132378 [Mycena rosella]
MRNKWLLFNSTLRKKNIDSQAPPSRPKPLRCPSLTIRPEEKGAIGRLLASLQSLDTLTIQEGQKFALALGLEDQPEIFNEYKTHFRRYANETFNLNLPLFQQTQNMNVFTDKVEKAFPAFFNEGHENHKERIKRLQTYARSYLDKSGKMSTPNGLSRGSCVSHNPEVPRKTVIVVDEPMSDAPPLGSAPKPPSRQTTYPHPSRTRKPSMVDEPMSDAPPLDTAPRPPSRHAVHPHPRPPPSRSRKTSMVDQPMPSAPPLDIVPPTRAPGLAPNKPAPTPAQQAAPGPTPGPPALVAPLAKFHPPMDHCAPAFQRAGVTKVDDLREMKHWEESQLRRFLTHTDIASTMLEEEAIIIGLNVRNKVPRLCGP